MSINNFWKSVGDVDQIFNSGKAEALIRTNVKGKHKRSLYIILT